MSPTPDGRQQVARNASLLKRSRDGLGAGAAQLNVAAFRASAVGVTVHLYPNLPVVSIGGVPQQVDLLLNRIEQGGLIDAKLRRVQVEANHLPLQQRLVGLQLPRSLEMRIEREIRLPVLGDSLRGHTETGEQRFADQPPMDRADPAPNIPTSAVAR